MNTEELDEISALYAAGILTEDERLAFEAAMETRPDWATHTARMNDIGAVVAAAMASGNRKPPCPAQFDKLLGTVRHRMPSIVERLFGISPDEAMTRPITVTDGRELVRWTSPAFLDMCGYTIDELLGRKLGEVLRGPLTDPDAVRKLRDGIQDRQPVNVQIINYHKNGAPYLVEVDITPVPGNCIESACFVAREKKLGDVAD